MPLKEGTFQIVVCQDVIGHFRDAWKLVREAIRVLGSQGRIIVTATRTSFMSRMISLYSRVWLGVYVRSYKVGELEKIFEVSGAKPVSSEVIGNTIVKFQATR